LSSSFGSSCGAAVSSFCMVPRRAAANAVQARPAQEFALPVGRTRPKCRRL
jgi:hypothetical protein